MRDLVIVIAAALLLAAGCTSAPPAAAGSTPLGTAAVTARLDEPDSELLRAAAAGDADAVAGALRAGADLEARDDRGRTALLLAVTRRPRRRCKGARVALGADADALDDRHDTPWLVTGVTGSVAMLEALLPAGAPT